MPVSRISAIRTATEAFKIAERAVCQSAIDTNRCVAILLEERDNGRFAPTLGADALTLLNDGARLSFEAQQRFTAAHKLLAVIPAEIGFGDFFGPSEDCPPNTPRGELRSVA